MEEEIKKQQSKTPLYKDTSPKRMKTMQAVVDKFSDKYHIEVYGRYKPWYKGFFTWLTREHREIYKNNMVSPDKVNELYNRSRVVLNIHQELQKDGANPRTFEIPGSGAWQICDYNPYIARIGQNSSVCKRGEKQNEQSKQKAKPHRFFPNER